MAQKIMVSYKYDNPSSAGPFKGRIEWTGKNRLTSGEAPKKGDSIYMMFGMATVTNVSKKGE